MELLSKLAENSIVALIAIVSIVVLARIVFALINRRGNKNDDARS